MAYLNETTKEGAIIGTPHVLLDGVDYMLEYLEQSAAEDEGFDEEAATRDQYTEYIIQLADALDGQLVEIDSPYDTDRNFTLMDADDVRRHLSE